MASDPIQWPHDIVTQDTSESKAETKTTKDLFSGAVFLWKDDLDSILDKFGQRKAMRICAFEPKNKTSGPLNAEELEEQHYSWIKRTQKDSDFKEDNLRLNLQENKRGILLCRGRIQGEYPMFLPVYHPYSEKLVERAHLDTLHDGIGLTMAKIRENHWIPHLRQLAKCVIRSCWGCRHY